MKKKTIKNNKTIEIGEKTIFVEKKQRNVALEIITFLVASGLIVSLTFLSRCVVYIDTIWIKEVCSSLIYVGFIFVSIVALLVTNQKEVLKIKIQKLWLQLLWAVILATILILMISIIPYVIFNGFNFKIVQDFDYKGLIFKGFYYLILVGTGEELFFRGFLQSTISKLFVRFDYFAPLITGLLFGCLHFINGAWEQVIIASFMGVFFGYMKFYAKNCTLLSVAGAHGLYDFILEVVKIFGI